MITPMYYIIYSSLKIDGGELRVLKIVSVKYILNCCCSTLCFCLTDRCRASFALQIPLNLKAPVVINEDEHEDKNSTKVCFMSVHENQLLGQKVTLIE